MQRISAKPLLSMRCNVFVKFIQLLHPWHRPMRSSVHQSFRSPHSLTNRRYHLRFRRVALPIRAGILFASALPALHLKYTGIRNRSETWINVLTSRPLFRTFKIITVSRLLRRLSRRADGISILVLREGLTGGQHDRKHY